ncbi:MAG: DNA repair protein RecN, partial [Rickettsiales bacterium]|nr:DNA repair protein RecN [Rickettsiales bacterium]
IETIEERLFALRAAARKHRVTVSELPDVLARMETELATIDAGDANLKKLESAAKTARAEYEKIAAELHGARVTAAEKMRGEILRELPDLKLGNADFNVSVSASGSVSAIGNDDVIFMIKTNPGTPFAPLNKIASGGELARFMLALRVVLSRGKSNRVFIFDEVDTGISGATAAAVGVRLARLAAGSQAIVITHSAQVAGHAAQHLLIKKETDGEQTTTTICDISGDARVAEIARIISGAEITNDSIAAAKKLIK